MAEKDQNDMSMDEILNSIRKYVNPNHASTHPSISENASQKMESEDSASPSPATESEIVRLPPLNEPSNIDYNIGDKEQKLKDLESLKMPNFFQKAYKNTEITRESASPSSYITSATTTPTLETENMEPRNFKMQKDPDDTFLSQPVEDASKQTFSLFRDKAQAIIHKSENRANMKTQPESTLDLIVQNAIKSAVAEWVNNHLQGIVETIVEKEIHKLTESLVSSENEKI